MKKILLLAALSLTLLQTTAAPVDKTTARSRAAEFLTGRAAQGRMMASAPTVKWVHEVKNSSNVALNAYYVVNTDRGFVIVAGDDRARAILAYGDQPLDNMNNLPENMRFWLGQYQQQIEFLQSRPGMVVEKPVLKAGGQSVAPLIPSKWDQGYPYYSQCPMDGDRRGLTGCATTSLAQVFYKWQYPTEPTPTIPGYTTRTKQFVLDELPSVTFDWDNMLDTYRVGYYNDDNKFAVAQLMRYIGQAEQMDYTNEGSEAWEDDILRACETFGYYDAHIAYKSVINFDTGVETEYINDNDWNEMLQGELAAGRPVVYCAYGYSSVYNNYYGHAFDVDGYDAATGNYSINWGWSGTGDGYYALHSFAYQGSAYNMGMLMVMGIEPSAPVASIKAAPSMVNLECTVGETATATFTVKGRMLNQDVTLTLNDADGVFAIDATTLTAGQAMNTTDVTVTYTPQAVGTNSASVTISSPEVEEDVTVILNGTAKAAPLVLVDPVMLPAAQEYITLTSFRADWTDETVDENVLSYTLDVNTKPNYVLLEESDWSYVSESFSEQSGNPGPLFPQGWSFSGYGLWAEDGFISINSNGAFTTSTYDMAGAGKVTIVLTAKASYPSASFTISTSVDSREMNLTDRTFQQYVIVLNCAASDCVTIASKSGNPGFLNMKIYAGEVEAPMMRATEQGDATHRLITGITDKFYTVNGLTAEGTFIYKVKALYADGTESAWSNTQEVTLFGPAYENGDVNHDGNIDVADVTALVSYLLTGSGENFYLDVANVNGEDEIDVADVTALITLVLGN